ncbi:MAG: transposase [Rhodospirillales bacterium]|nr:transposase [Rhodospirillales bacterium]
MWADGLCLQARMESQAECMLVIIGATPDGKKELLGFQVGFRESAQSWKEHPVSLKGKSLTVAPALATGVERIRSTLGSGSRSARCFLAKARERLPATSGARCTACPEGTIGMSTRRLSR